MTLRPGANDRPYESRPAIKTIAFTGASGLGAQGTITLFTVTGRVVVDALAVFCSENLVGAGNLQLGHTGTVAAFIASTLATDIDADEFWGDASPTELSWNVPSGQDQVVIADDIILTIDTADITDGTLEFTVYWHPWSAGSSLVVA